MQHASSVPWGKYGVPICAQSYVANETQQPFSMCNCAQVGDGRYVCWHERYTTRNPEPHVTVARQTVVPIRIGIEYFPTQSCQLLTCSVALVHTLCTTRRIHSRTHRVALWSLACYLQFMYAIICNAQFFGKCNCQVKVKLSQGCSCTPSVSALQAPTQFQRGHWPAVTFQNLLAHDEPVTNV